MGAGIGPWRLPAFRSRRRRHYGRSHIGLRSGRAVLGGLNCIRRKTRCRTKRRPARPGGRRCRATRPDATTSPADAWKQSFFKKDLHHPRLSLPIPLFSPLSSLVFLSLRFLSLCANPHHSSPPNPRLATYIPALLRPLDLKSHPKLSAGGRRPDGAPRTLLLWISVPRRLALVQARPPTTQKFAADGTATPPRRT